jgi:hypothetical protein
MAPLILRVSARRARRQCVVLHSNTILQYFLFFAENISKVTICMDVLQLFICPQIEDTKGEQGDILFQNDGAPDHFL